jgi:hypothetical protein
MHRLLPILALSHLLLAGGCVALYIQPNLVGAGTIVAGAFLRWMVPHRGYEERHDFRTYIRAGIMGLLAKWLADVGLVDFISKAWSERFSILPILGFSFALLYLVIFDWFRVTKMSSADFDRFYEEKKNEA